jgi:hypothetical protein
MATPSTFLEIPPRESTPSVPSEDSLPILRLAAHELRQQLSSVESIAFYLKLVLARSEPKLCTQVEKIEDLVQQTSWVLTDTMHTLQTELRKVETIELARLLRRAAYEIGREEGTRVHVVAPDQPMQVECDVPLFDYMVRSTCRCIMHLGRAECIVRLHRPNAGDCILMEFCIQPRGETEETPSPLPAGSVDLAARGIRNIAELHGGTLRCLQPAGGRPRWEIEIPLARGGACEHAA